MTTIEKIDRAKTVEAIKKNIRKAAKEAGISLRGNSNDITGPFSGYSFEEYRYICVDTVDLVSDYADAATAEIEICEGYELGNFTPVWGYWHVMSKYNAAADVLNMLANELEESIYNHAVR